MNRHQLLRHRRADRGFSLVKLLVVVGSLGVLSAVLIFAVRGRGDKGQEAATAPDERVVNGGSASSTSSTPPATTSLWVVQKSGVTSKTLVGVDCFDVNTCVAVGDDDTIVRTVDGGANWVKEESEKAESGFPLDLLGVSCAGPTTCIATGRGATILKRQENTTPKWTRQSFSGSSSDIIGLFEVDCPTPTNCFAVGSPPINLAGTEEAVEPTIIASTDGGSMWQDQVGLSQQLLQDVSCLNDQSCIASGSYGAILITENGGLAWTTTHSDVGDIYVPGSTCLSATVCLAITSDTNNSGRIMRSTSGGAAWPTSDTIDSPSPGTALNGIRCADTTRCFIVGGEGKIFSSADGGVTWTTDSVPSGFDKSLDKVSCVGPAEAKKCWAVGDAGSIMVKELS